MKGKRAGTFLVAMMCGVLMWTGCSTAWIGEAEQIVAALMPAVGNLLTLVGTLEGKSISAADLQAIQNAGAQAGADLQLLQSLIAEYEKADAPGKPGLLNQIQATMGAAQSTLNGLLPALHIKDAAIQAKVSAVVGLLISEVASMEEVIPLAKTGASPEMMETTRKEAKRQAPLTASEFVRSYNATMTAKTGNGELDHVTAGLRIYSHGRLERWSSAGLLK